MKKKSFSFSSLFSFRHSTKMCFFYGLLWSTGFLPPLSDAFRFLSFFLRLSLSSIGFLGFLHEQFWANTRAHLFGNAWAFGAVFWFVSLFGLYKAFWVTQHSFLFLPCLGALAFFWGCFTGALHPLLFQPAKPKDKIRFVLSFSFVWVGTEYMRSVFWPQFPWNLTAHLFCFEDFIVPSLMIQIVSWGGVYVLSLIWSLFLASFYSASTMLKSMTILLLVGGMGYGGWVLFAPSSKTQQKLRTFRVMVVQPNISQKEKVASEMAEDILKKTWDFTLKAGGGKSGVGLIVWPETALLHMITPTHPILKKIQKALPAKTFLIFGADRLSSIASKRPVWHNSLFVLSKTEILATYDKTRLLPFGEYMPLRKFFPHFLNRIVPGVDCTPGPSVLPLKIKGFPSFLPRICSESLYKTPKTSAQWIVHILNDGWFPLPFLWQHLAADRLRTVESGLPLLRVSNTGISVFIDVLGRIKHQLPIQRQAAQEVEVSASED